VYTPGTVEPLVAKDSVNECLKTTFAKSRFRREVPYTVKNRFAIFPSPAEMSVAKLSQAGNILIIPGQGEFG
jgi:hypothetical protein